MARFKAGVCEPDNRYVPPPIACPECAALAESQGRLPDDPRSEVLACPECGEFWIAPASSPGSA